MERNDGRSQRNVDSGPENEATLPPLISQSNDVWINDGGVRVNSQLETLLSSRYDDTKELQLSQINAGIQIECKLFDAVIVDGDNSVVISVEEWQPLVKSSAAFCKVVPNALFTVDDRNYEKPLLTYNALVTIALKSGDASVGLTVGEIYQRIAFCFPYFSNAKNNWKNSIRHTLATSKWFRKTDWHKTEKKGFKWTLNEKFEDQLKEELSQRRLSVDDLKNCVPNSEIVDFLNDCGVIISCEP